MNSNKIFTINWQDLLKGLITTFLTAFLTSIYQWINGGSFPTVAQWKTAAIVGLAAGIGYLLKNFLTNSQDKFLTLEPKKP